MSNKAELRNLIREKRRALSPQRQLAAANGLLTRLQTVPQFLDSEKIAMYLANDGEIDPIAVMHWCWEQGKSTYVPIVVEENGLSAETNVVKKEKTKQTNTLLFSPVTDQTQFMKNKFGIKEPVVEAIDMIQARLLDLVLMPLVAFDEMGNRVGMGGGFYDTTFEFKKDDSIKKPNLIGIAHEVQKVKDISTEHWDIPLSTVVTDRMIYGRND